MPLAGEILATTTIPDLRVLLALGTLGIGGKFLKPYARIEQGEEAIRTRGGNCSRHKNGPAQGQVKVSGPGPHLMIPFSHEWHRQSVKAQTTSLGDIRIDRKDEPRYDCEATVQWRVIPSGVENNTIGRWMKPWRKPWTSSQTNDYPYRARLETENLEETVRTLCRDGLATAMTNAPVLDFRDSRRMTEKVQTICSEELLIWGAEVLRITLDQPGVESDIDRLGAYMHGLPPEDRSNMAGVASALAEHGSDGFKLRLVRDDEPAS